MINLDIYVLSRNRESYLKDAIQSIIKSLSICENFEANIIISDNSSIQIPYLNSLQDKFSVVLRRPNISVNDHVRLCIEESSSDYIMLFHDDDLVCEEFFNQMFRVITSRPDFSAYGCGAVCINESGKILNQKFLISTKSKGFININRTKLIEHYFSSIPCNYPPFSSYIYKSHYVKGLYPNPKQGGKYADLTFLMNLADKKDLIWIKYPGILYRIHGLNDGFNPAISDYLNLIFYLIRTGSTYKTKFYILRAGIIYIIKSFISK